MSSCSGECRPPLLRPPPPLPLRSLEGPIGRDVAMAMRGGSGGSLMEIALVG